MNTEPEPITESWEELRAGEERERMELLALPPQEAQARADVLFGRLWKPVRAELFRRLPGAEPLPAVLVRPTTPARPAD